jgi:hypothetical protein
MAVRPKTAEEREMIFAALSRRDSLAYKLANAGRPNSGKPHDGDAHRDRFKKNVEDLTSDVVEAARNLAAGGDT